MSDLFSIDSLNWEKQSLSFPEQAQVAIAVKSIKMNVKYFIGAYS